MTVAVLVDSAATLPDDLVTRHDIAVIPLQLVVGGESYDDGDLSLDQLIARLGEGVSTSAPSPGSWAQALIDRSEQVERDGALLLTVSSNMSASHQIATLAAQQVEGDVRVVDTTTAAGGEGLVALAAAEAASDGSSLDECEAVANRVAERVHLVATLDDLEQLAKSGRVPSAAAWAGNRLHVNPVFEFRDGEAHPRRPALSREAALDRIASECRDTRPSGAVRLHAAALHAQAPDAADWLLQSVVTSEDDRIFRGDFSAAMVAHTGPGLAGLAWWWEEMS